MSKRTPTGLGRAGRALWRALAADYELDAAETVLAEAACRQLDDVTRLETIIAADGLVVAGSKGQPRLSQCVTEVRQGRLALAKLVDALRLPADDEEVGRTVASRRAQRAAQARWRDGRTEVPGGPASA